MRLNNTWLEIRLTFLGCQLFRRKVQIARTLYRRQRQATDRVHRIWQTRVVQVFKLVTAGTVEDLIHAFIEKKRKRMEEIVGGDEAQVIKTLTRDELIEIFQEVR